MIPFVDLQKQFQSIETEILPVIEELVRSQRFVGGAAVSDFEQMFASYAKVPHCIACSNGTDAISLALRALNIGLGDEVIIPANSFVATAEAVSAVGAQPIFVDCRASDFTIDPNEIEGAITANTKAIIPVHLFGQMAQMDTICAIAKTRNLFVIEDSAQAHGAEFDKKRPGEWGDAATFSFFPGKNLGAYGDAGAVVCRDAQLAKRVRMLKDHGRIDKYNHKVPGFNNRMDALQARVLSVKLKHIENWTEQRRQVSRCYRELLTRGCHLPLEREECRHVYHLFVVRVMNRVDVVERLKERGIQSGVHYPIPLHKLEAYANNDVHPIAESYSEQILSLPMFPELTREQVTEVAAVLNEFGQVPKH